MSAQRSSHSRSSQARHRRQPQVIAVPPAAAAPTTPSTPDYAQQLHSAILTTREAILTENSTADASRDAALGGLDVARRTFADARIGLKGAVANNAVTAFLDQKLGDANQTALNAVTLSENATAEAQASTAAMGDAATSIKAAAASVEKVIMDVNSVAGLTNTNDRDDEINKAAHDAVVAVARLGKSVDELKCLALIANVQAASPRTLAIQQAAQANQTSIANLLATFDATLKATTDAVTTAQAARTTDLTDLFNQSASYTIASSNDHALGKAVEVMDSISNDSLTVVVKNAPLLGAAGATAAEEKKGVKPAAREKPAVKSKGANVVGADSQAIAGFEASWEFPAEVAKFTVAMTCFAVPVADAPSFDYQAALLAQKSGYCATFTGKGGEQPGLPRTGSVVLQRDSNGQPIEFGSSYRIFALRSPDADHGPQTATDFSFPTPPITATVLLEFPAVPQLYPPNATTPALPHNAFVAIFEAAQPLDAIDNFRLFFAPTEVLERGKDNELIIADALNAASFSQLDADSGEDNIHPQTLANALWKQINGEVSTGGSKPPPTPATLVDWIEKATSGDGPYFVVYFSPFATKEGPSGKGFFLARYTDMYGDLFDLDDRSYKALVLAVGMEVASGEGQKAANVLSKPSAAFPADVVVPPLPTDGGLKPAKE